jgi:hypothetical protein
MNNTLTGFVRTVVPLVVGWLIYLAARAGLDVNADDLAPTITILATAVYWAAAHWLETHVDKRFGWLFGKPGAPVYPVKDAATDAATALYGAVDAQLAAKLNEAVAELTARIGAPPARPVAGGPVTGPGPAAPHMNPVQK